MRTPWLSYVRGMVYQYPELVERHREGLEQKTTPVYSPMPGAGQMSRKVENAVVREMTKGREYDAVNKAVRAFPPERLPLINLVFWKRSHTLSGAAQALFISYTTAKRWERAFIQSVANFYGLLD